MSKRKDLLPRLENRLLAAEHEQDGAKSSLQQVQYGQQKLQSAVSPVQNEICALATGLKKGQHYLRKRQDVTGERTFLDMGKGVRGQVRQFNNTMYNETMKTFDVYIDGLQTCLKKLVIFVATSLVEPPALKGSAWDALSTTELKFLGDGS